MRGTEANMRKRSIAFGAGALLALAFAAPATAAPAKATTTDWFWTSQRAESRVLVKLGVPAYCRGVGETRNGEHVPLVYDRRFECLAPRLDGTVWSFTLQVRGNHRFELTTG